MLALLLGCALALSDPTRMSFTLEDQFGRIHSSEMLASRVSIIVYADRAGSRYAGDWVVGVQDDFPTDSIRSQIAVFRIANLRGVPRLLRWRAKTTFSRDTSDAVLLDWEGCLAEKYHLRSGVSIFVVDASGTIAARLTGLSHPQADAAEAVAEQIRILLARSKQTTVGVSANGALQRTVQQLRPQRRVFGGEFLPAEYGTEVGKHRHRRPVSL